MKSSTVAKGLAATALVLPALVNGLLHFVDPLTGDDAEAELRQAIAHPTLTELDNLKLLLLLLVPAVVLVGLVTFRRAPWSTLLGVTLVSVSFIANTLDLAEYQIFSVASRHQDVFVPALQVTEDSAITSALSAVFLIGSLAGMVLVGVALLRSRTAPRWAGWAVTASGPLNVVGHLGTPRIVDVVAWLLLAAGLAAVAPRVFEVIDRAAGIAPAPEPAATAVGGTLAPGRS